MDEQVSLDNVFDLLTKRFYDWYMLGGFDDWLSGATPGSPEQHEEQKKELKQELRRMIG